MHQRAFDSSYTGFTADGAKYLAENTNVKTIGIDYLSIATYEENSKAHVHLLKKVWCMLSPLSPVLCSLYLAGLPSLSDCFISQAFRQITTVFWTAYHGR